MPFDTSPATYSKCGVPPRITQPKVTTPRTGRPSTTLRTSPDELERARAAVDVDRVVVHAVAHQRVERAVEQRLGDERC